jgi:hypothetical protein
VYELNAHVIFDKQGFLTLEPLQRFVNADLDIYKAIKRRAVVIKNSALISHVRGRSGLRLCA